MSQDPQERMRLLRRHRGFHPGLLVNRPGLSAIAYRVGTYQTFRQSLHARLSDGRWPVLRGLRTRDDDDFTIALLDAWAVTGDILTFTKSVLPTKPICGRPRSDFRFWSSRACSDISLVQVWLRPRIWPSRWKNNPGLPGTGALPITLAVGTKVQTVPGPDEQPQTFETVEAIEARPAWNAPGPADRHATAELEHAGVVAVGAVTSA